MHGLIDCGTNAVLRYHDFGDEPVPTLAPEKGRKWLPVNDTKPTPGEGETLTGPVVTVTETSVTRVWTAAPYVAPVPFKVTNFQARAALMAADLFDQVDTALKTGGDAVALQAWEYANDVTRGGALVNGLAASLGWTQEQLDDLFRAAAVIEA